MVGWRMKTIKELEAEIRIYNRFQRDEDGEKFLIADSELRALKDVLELIDEQIYDCVKNECDAVICINSIKSKIKGKDGN